MADVRDRDALEAKLARLLGRSLGVQRKEILAKLGDPPNLARLTAEDWARWQKDLSAALGPALQDVFLQQAKELLDNAPGGVDWALVNKQAADWARGYTFELVAGVNANSQAALQAAVATYFEQGQTIGDLETALQPTFSPVRAEMIARTEVTRAAVQGETELAADLAEQGIVMEEIYRTRNDEAVCPVCGPRNGQPITDGKRPPLHPRCRCFTTHELPKAKR